MDGDFFCRPCCKKRFGKISGVVILGILWGFWHLPLDIFTMLKSSLWLQTLITRQITCISIAIFIGYTYLKTKNIWVPIFLHFINNNYIAILNYSANPDTSLQQVSQKAAWGDVLLMLVVNSILFSSFILSKVYRNRNKDSEDINISLT